MVVDLIISLLFLGALIYGLMRGALRPILGVIGWVSVAIVAPNLRPFTESALLSWLVELDYIWVYVASWALTVTACWLIFVRGYKGAGTLIRDGSLLLKLADTVAGLIIGAGIGLVTASLSLLIIHKWAELAAPSGWIVAQAGSSTLLSMFRALFA